MTVEAWLDSLPARHARDMTRPEFLKAIRALSARYVEGHGTLPDKAPLDSAGKRAAFAGFYAPMHFLTTRAIVSALGPVTSAMTSVIDLGCGTGVAGAAVALATPARPTLTGMDLGAWVLDEARETWRSLGLRGRATRGDFVTELERLAATPHRSRPAVGVGLVLGWSLNELDRPGRERAQRAIADLAGRGVRILAIEPVARRLVPWWAEWADRSAAAGARADEWRFPADLPPTLAGLDRDAGFQRDGLTARSVAFNW